MTNYLDFQGLQTCNTAFLNKVFRNSVKASYSTSGTINLSSGKNVFTLYNLSYSSSISISGRTKNAIDEIWVNIFSTKPIVWPLSVQFDETCTFDKIGYYCVRLTTFDSGLTWTGELFNSSADVPTKWTSIASNGIINPAQSKEWLLDGTSVNSISIAQSTEKYFWLNVEDGSNSISWPQKFSWSDGKPNWTAPDNQQCIFFCYTLNGTTWYAKQVKTGLIYWKYTVDTSLGEETTTKAEVPFFLNYFPSITMDVDWGDGTTEHIDENSLNREIPSHTYAESGTYQITLKCNNFDKLFIESCAEEYDEYEYEYLTGDKGIYRKTLKSIDSPLPKVLGVVSSPNRNHIYYDSFFKLFSGCTALESIPSGLFDYNPNVKNCDEIFYNCSSLQSLPNDIFKKNVNIVSISYGFSKCTSLTSLPENLFAYNTNLSNIDTVFYGCTAISSIPSSLFGSNSKITGAYAIFSKCSSLTAIPSGLFSGLPNLRRFDYTFSECSSLASIPSDLFSGLTYIQSVNGCFEKCTSLTAIPSGLFSGLTALAKLDDTFSGCTSLASLPSSLFANSGVIDLTSAFEGCTSLAAIPTDLFTDSVIQILYRCFADCKALTTIPAGLFTPIRTTLQSCTYCFYNCKGLTSLPTGVFTNLSALETLKYCFYGCTKLTTLPAGAFSDMNSLTSLEYCFYSCTGLKSLPTGVFTNLSSLKNANYCFGYCTSLTTLSSGLFSSTAKVKTLDYCFRNCTSLTTLPSSLFCSSVTSLNSCFYNCTQLATIPSDLLSGLTSLTTMTYCFSSTKIASIPTGLFNGLTALSTIDSCFRSCASLTTIPESLLQSNANITSVTYLFYYCSALNDFTLHIGSTKIKSASNFVSKKTTATRTIYVPSGSTTRTTFNSISSGLSLTIVAE